MFHHIIVFSLFQDLSLLDLLIISYVSNGNHQNSLKKNEYSLKKC